MAVSVGSLVFHASLTVPGSLVVSRGVYGSVWSVYSTDPHSASCNIINCHMGLSSSDMSVADSYKLSPRVCVLAGLQEDTDEPSPWHTLFKATPVTLGCSQPSR